MLHPAVALVALTPTPGSKVVLGSMVCLPKSTVAGPAKRETREVVPSLDMFLAMALVLRTAGVGLGDVLQRTGLRMAGRGPRSGRR